jgi:beta-glucosidase
MNMSTTATSRDSWMTKLKALAGNGVDQARIDDACRRILRLKFRMNLWERPVSNAKHFATIGSQAHRDVARKAVRESIVLLKNDNSVLPLNKSDKIVVCGEWADSIGWQCGAWTKNWQGDIYHTNAELGGTSLLDGMTAVGSNVVSRPDGNDIPTDAKAIVLFVGEIPYAESQGDNDHVMDDWLVHDNNDKTPYAFRGYKIYMDLGQIMAENDRIGHTHFADIYTRIKSQAPNVPIVTVLLSGRPIIINTQLNASAAFVAAWFPGTEGKGVAEVLFNDNGADFTGKLTHTWPASYSQIPINTDPKSDEQVGSGGQPLFKYGFGLTY